MTTRRPRILRADDDFVVHPGDEIELVVGNREIARILGRGEAAQTVLVGAWPSVVRPWWMDLRSAMTGSFWGRLG